VVPVVRLTEVFRLAASSKIITNAHLIRHGKMPEPRTAEPGTDFYFIERDTPEEIAATLVRLVQDRIGCILRQCLYTHITTSSSQMVPSIRIEPKETLSIFISLSSSRHWHRAEVLPPPS
jgi:hypothetical protein